MIPITSIPFADDPLLWVSLQAGLIFALSAANAAAGRPPGRDWLALHSISTLSGKPRWCPVQSKQALEQVLEVLSMPAGWLIIAGTTDSCYYLGPYRGLGESSVDALERLLKESLPVPEHAGDPPWSIKTARPAETRFAPLCRALKSQGLSAMTLYPIESAGLLLGLLGVSGRRIRHFSPRRQAFLDACLSGFAAALYGIRLREQAEKLTEDMAALQEINKIASLRTDIEEVIRGIVIEGRRLVRTQHCSLLLVDDRSQRITGSASTQTEGFDIRGMEFDLSGDSFAAQALREKQVIAVDSRQHAGPAERKFMEDAGWHASIIAPLIAKEQAIGILVFSDNLRERGFTQEELMRAETLAHQAAIAIENARLFQVVRRSQREWETTVDAMQDCVSVHDPGGRLVRANRALARRLNTVPQQLIGRFCSELYSPPGLRFESCRHMQSLQAEPLLVEEVELPHMGGIFQISISPWYDKNNRVVGSIHVAKDISNEKLLQQQLIQSEKLSAIGELISGIAHELNNPLTGVMGYSQLLQLRRDLDDRARDCLLKINNLALRCQKIVQNLLSFARKKKPERSPTNVNELLEKTIDLRSYELSVNNIAIQRELDRNLPNTIADAHQLQQVFLNIITNAEQAMLESSAKGLLTVRSRLDARNPLIVVEIEDTGPGIPEKVATRIFDPFFTTKEVGKGTGLGLSIAYGIMQEHGGRILVRSRPGEGATFVVEIPIISTLKDEARIFPALMPQALRFEGLVRGKRVLVVDDERYILDFLVEVFRMFPMEVDTAGDGREAMDKLLARDYDLVVTDLKMPEMGGRELFQWIRIQRPALSRRVVFVTGDTVSSETRAFFEGNSARYIAKPFKIDEIKEVIQQTLEGGGHDSVGETDGPSSQG